MYLIYILKACRDRYCKLAEVINAGVGSCCTCPYTNNYTFRVHPVTTSSTKAGITVVFPLYSKVESNGMKLKIKYMQYIYLVIQVVI